MLHSKGPVKVKASSSETLKTTLWENKIKWTGLPWAPGFLTLVSLNEARLGFKGLVTDVLKGIIWTWSSQEPILLGSIHSSMPHVLNILIKTLPVGIKSLGNLPRKFMAVWVVISSLVYPSILKNQENEAINILGSSWCGHQRAGKGTWGGA